MTPLKTQELELLDFTLESNLKVLRLIDSCDSENKSAAVLIIATELKKLCNEIIEILNDE